MVIVTTNALELLQSCANLAIFPQLLKKLQTSESTIENLNLQLEELGRSDSLARARDQHEAIVSGMHNKHEAELLVLKQKLDQANLEKTEKVRIVGNGDESWVLKLIT